MAGPGGVTSSAGANAGLSAAGGLGSAAILRSDRAATVPRPGGPAAEGVAQIGSRGPTGGTERREPSTRDVLSGRGDVTLRDRPDLRTGRQGNGTPIDPDDVISPGDDSDTDTGRQGNGSQPRVHIGPASEWFPRGDLTSTGRETSPILEAVEELLGRLDDISIEDLLDRIRDFAGRQKNGHRQSDPTA